MSASFSYAQIGGSLGKDPESRSTPTGTKVVSFSVAVEKGFGDSKSTSWFNVVAFKDMADFAEKYLKKGKAVRVSGDLQIRSWDNKTTGQKQYTTEIIAYKIDFGGSGERQQGSNPRTTTPPPRQQATPEPRAAAEAPRPSQPTNSWDDETDIPF